MRSQRQGMKVKSNVGQSRQTNLLKKCPVVSGSFQKNQAKINPKLD